MDLLLAPASTCSKQRKDACSCRESHCLSDRVRAYFASTLTDHDSRTGRTRGRHRMHRHANAARSLCARAAIDSGTSSKVQLTAQGRQILPYLVLTGEALPRIMYTRHPPKGSENGGRFQTQARRNRSAIAPKEPRHTRQGIAPRAAAMHIGLCAGPCIDAEGYLERVNAARKSSTVTRPNCSNSPLRWTRPLSRTPTSMRPSCGIAFEPSVR